MEVRDCASPDMSCDSPSASRTMSAAFAASTAFATPPSIGERMSQPLTTVRRVGSAIAARKPVAMSTPVPLSP
jgi:hypothetical protein